MRAAAAPSSPMEWARLFPLNHGMLNSMHLTRSMMQAVLQRSSAVAGSSSISASGGGATCQYPECGSEVARHCSECRADYCIAHDRTLHELVPSHKRVPVHATAAASKCTIPQNAIGPAAAQRRQQLQEQLALLHKQSAASMDKKKAYSSAVEKAAAVLEDARRVYASLFEQLTGAKKQHQADAAAVREQYARVQRANALNDIDLLNESTGGSSAAAGASATATSVATAWLRRCRVLASLRGQSQYTHRRQGTLFQHACTLTCAALVSQREKICSLRASVFLRLRLFLRCAGA